MKYTVITIAAALATTLGIEFAKPAPVQSLPETVVVAQKTEPRLYTATLRIEMLCPVAAASALEKIVSQEISEGSPEGVVVAVHCTDCSIGVYAVREDTKEYCTYCNNSRK